jgi:hypothetical protein
MRKVLVIMISTVLGLAGISSCGISGEDVGLNESAIETQYCDMSGGMNIDAVEDDKFNVIGWSIKGMPYTPRGEERVESNCTFIMRDVEKGFRQQGKKDGFDELTQADLRKTTAPGEDKYFYVFHTIKDGDLNVIINWEKKEKN